MVWILKIRWVTDPVVYSIPISVLLFKTTEGDFLDLFLFNIGYLLYII